MSDPKNDVRSVAAAFFGVLIDEFVAGEGLAAAAAFAVAETDLLVVARIAQVADAGKAAGKIRILVEEVQRRVHTLQQNQVGAADIADFAGVLQRLRPDVAGLRVIAVIIVQRRLAGGARGEIDLDGRVALGGVVECEKIVQHRGAHQRGPVGLLLPVIAGELVVFPEKALGVGEIEIHHAGGFHVIDLVGLEP